MAYFTEGFPFSNMHDLNLDWIIDRIRNLEAGNVAELAALLETGIEGDSMVWIAESNTLIIKDSNGDEVYRIVFDVNGFTLHYNGGTPLSYALGTGRLTTPVSNSTQLLTGSGTVTGNFNANKITATTTISAGGNITSGGALNGASAVLTGGLNAGSANLSGNATVGGTLNADTLNPTNPLAVSKGGTGATSAAAARANLGLTYKAGDNIVGAFRIIGRAVNAGDAIYGTLTLDRPITASTVSFSDLGTSNLYTTEGLRTLTALSVVQIDRNQLYLIVNFSGTTVTPGALAYIEINSMRIIFT